MSFREPVSKNPDMILPGQKPHPAYRASTQHFTLFRRLLRALAKLVRA